MSDYFQIPPRWRIAAAIWRQSLEDMAADGARGREGVALWLGTADEEEANISQCVWLRGPGVIKAPAQLVISAALLNEVTIAALERDLILVGQIHSHSPLATTDLSYPDRHMGISEPGYLSLVAPNFACDAGTGISDCGVHLHEGESGWRRLGLGEIGRRFKLDGQDCPPPLVIGGKA